MRIKKVSLTNFRNYVTSSVDLSEFRNVLIGENAQGKTNFLEAIEIISLGRSSRAQHEIDLIRKGADFMRIDLLFDSNGAEVSASYTVARSDKPRSRGIEKQIKINGLTIGSPKGLRGRLVTVSFKSSDLNLLRGGPKCRREWIDDMLVTLKPAYHDVLTKYQKSVAQRNRLLKMLFEKGKVSVSDQDQLKAWDEQAARLGAQIIKQRIYLLNELLPEAERHQELISGQREKLTAQYLFRASEAKDEGEEQQPAEREQTVPSALLLEQSENEIAATLMKMMHERRSEEIGRKQTLCGPHRDDIQFCLNDADAVEFASQGQQRSLVLSFKLAELERVQASLNEPPVLLLDDVLAELDLNRQGHLMSLVKKDMQTLITTTHVTGFKPEWVEGALFLDVQDGSITAIREPQAVI